MSDSDDDAFPSAHSPSSDPPPSQRQNKRKVQKVLGARPEGQAKPVDELCYQCVLSEFLEQEDGFFDDNTSFSRISGMRHIAHLEYVVPREGDGLHPFLKDLVCCEVNVKKCVQGACVGRVLERLQSMEEDCEIFLKLPQLFHGKKQHRLDMHDKNAVDLLDGGLCILGGDQYKPVRVRTDMPVEENGFLLSDSARQAGSAHVIFRWPDREELKIEKRNSGEVKITLCSPVYDQECLREQKFDAPTEAGTLLEPDTWLYRRISEFRRNHGASDRQKLNPLHLLQLRCAVNLGEKGLIAGVLHILSNGGFRSCSRQTAKGSEFDLWVCGGNCLWSVDAGNAAWRQLCKLLQCQIRHLASSPDLGLLISALNEDDDLDQLKLVIASKDPKLGGVDGVTEEHLLAEVQSRCTYVGGQYLPMKEIEVAYAPFLYLVHDQTFKYDAAPQLNFTDGWCYDPVLRSARRIRPSDGATLSCGYSYPEFDQSKYDPLEAFLKEVHPDKEVLAFRLSELAKCLNMKQSDVTVLLCHGTAGAGKTLTTQLFAKTFGDYGYVPDKTLFAKQSRVDAEAASAARLKLKNKCYVATDEVNGIDTNSLKAWCGGGKITARGLFKDTESFTAMFNLTEMTFNDLFILEKDGGLERRICVIRFSTVFIPCKDEKEATKTEEEWKKDGETGRATMYDAKYERIMALKSQLMAHLIRVHQKGEFVEKFPPPPKIAEWTAKLWAGSAAENPLQKPMELWYGPCGCNPRDAADDTTRNLWDRDGKRCIHKVQAKEIMDKLKGMQLENGKSTCTSAYRAIALKANLTSSSF